MKDFSVTDFLLSIGYNMFHIITDNYLYTTHP